MEFYDPPPDLGKEEKIIEEYKLIYTEKDYQGKFSIRKARVTDVKPMLSLINGFAASNLMLPRGPQYLYENIRDFVVILKKDKNGQKLLKPDSLNQEVLACGSLHVLWEELAEIRSLAILPEFQGYGFGNQIIHFMKKEARLLGVTELFTFTLAEEFFKKLGFEDRRKEDLPSKVWGECSKCPKYYRCDEVGLILKI